MIEFANWTKREDSAMASTRAGLHGTVCAGLRAKCLGPAFARQRLANLSR